MREDNIIKFMEGQKARFERSTMNHPSTECRWLLRGRVEGLELTFHLFRTAHEEGRLEALFDDIREWCSELVGGEQPRTIVSVDAECHISYSDGTSGRCQYSPPYTYAECGPGYGSGGHCPKWEFIHRAERGEHQ